MLSLLALLLIIGGGYAYFHNHGSGASTKIVTVGTAVAAPRTTVAPAPSKSTGGESAPSARNAGGATDTHGTASPSTSSSQWVSSASGDITVKQPAANAKLQDGSILSGSAKVNEVHYRLIDNTVGKIAEGVLSVSGGNFSGTLHFDPQGTGGRLDVFSTDSQGVEYNEVQINVSF